MLITQNDKDAAVIKVSSVRFSTSPPDQYSEGPQNGYFMTANVTVKTRPGFTEGFDTSSFDFYTVQRGEHFEEGDGNSLYIPASDRELDTVTLGAGESATGTLVFDVPRIHGKIAYSPNLEGGPVVTWRY